MGTVLSFSPREKAPPYAVDFSLNSSLNSAMAQSHFKSKDEQMNLHNAVSHHHYHYHV